MLFFFLFLYFLASPVSLLAFDLEGEVKLKAPFPPPVWLEIPAEHQATCGARKLSPKLRISADGAVANAVVRLEDDFLDSKNLFPNEKFVLDQIDCEFSPHVILIPKGSELSILNSEAILHNVRAFNEKIEMLFNDAMPKKGQVLKKRFEEHGRIVLRCGIHHWMHAIAIVTEHPFQTVTDERGYFKIANIPDGAYALTVWHETLGELRAKVTPQTKDLVLTYSPRSS